MSKMKCRLTMGAGEGAAVHEFIMPRWGLKSAIISMVAAGVIFGPYGQAKAVPPSDPAPNKVVSSCTFNGSLPLTFTNPSGTSSFEGGQVRVSYIIVYVKDTPNHGQQLTGGGGYTGPVICRNTAGADGIGEFVEVTEETVIPTETHGGGTVDILDTNGAFILKYQLNDGSGNIENRICQSASGGVGCFLAQPQ